MEAAEQSSTNREVAQETAFVYIPKGVLYYTSLNNLRMVPNRAEHKAHSEGANFHHIELDQNGRFLTLKETDPNNPDEKNRVTIKGRGLYVKVQLGEESFWVPYNKPPKKSRKPNYRFT
ncbi:MAG: hypothetical protein A3B38_03935 [Candidatus Levybacteria bacterium RIFCSPLOWO2_01_FULL_36_13]|nr:MAG: hypothetical protein A2684_00870 [Candidatus Levybacteria bacterium RIFCSPHIGHO2_01_FULL_36_15b]OGH34280.1 MAG: hypothetical protein A3B38_03935 [Candidatus Levybacteria bacterium RIFCSPLOWO2_01_FULL_36_13]